MKNVPHVLACDVGNTSISFADVQGEVSSSRQSFPIGNLGNLGSAISKLWDQIPTPKVIAACSVNPSGLKALEAAVNDSTGQKVLVIPRDLPLPMETNVPQPESIGVDRVCCAAAAFDHLG